MYMYALTCESPPQSVVLNFLSVHDPCSPFLHGLSDLHQLLPHTHTHGSYKLACISYTVEPLNKGHLGIHRQLSFIRRLSLIGRFVSKHTLLQHQYFIFSVYIATTDSAELHGAIQMHCGQVRCSGCTI